LKKSKPPAATKAGLVMVKVFPKTENQKRVLVNYAKGKHLVIHGLAGTGKTFLACYLGMTSLLAKEQERIIIYRSAVPTRDMGFMPGSAAEKSAPYEVPYKYVFAELFERADAYEILKARFTVEFSTSSYLRGLTLRDSVVIVDEMQNWSWHELDSMITRAGEDTRFIFCGDFRQSDLKSDHEREGLEKFMRVISDISSFAMVEMKSDDIVRSALVRDYILAKDKQGTT